MGVGINGMGRIGRLVLRAGFGGVPRAAGDPRAGNRLDVVHVNELKGGHRPPHTCWNSTASTAAGTAPSAPMTTRPS
jgi:glyceraldehyde-3-phosphate dehydrogenase/erythrose-4-phosphate dehydrogenase